MSGPSSSASASAIVGSPSTSPASLRGKRKATTEFFSHVSPPPLPSDVVVTQDLAAKNDNSGDEVEKPVKKKVKKPLEKIVPVWKDLKQWKEGDDPLGRFPVEVLDLIISVDSDLDLRDHLALAGTCRYFRTCYRDVVFRVLFQAAFPYIAPRAAGVKVTDDEVGEVHTSFSSAFEFGPFQRSFNDGRRIFSSGRSLVGAGGWQGWGLTRKDFEESEQLQQQRTSMQEDLDEYWKKRPLKLTKYEERDIAIQWSRVASRPKKKREEQKQAQTSRFMRAHDVDRRNQAYALEDAYGLLPWYMGLGREACYWRGEITYTYDWVGPVRELLDPWPSIWRETVSRIVLTPSVSRKDAKEKYKLSDRELLGLKARDPPWFRKKNTKYYFKAAVESLSLRSHGGVGGHQEHIAKLETRKLKARATREKNDALLGRKSKASIKREEDAAKEAAREEREAAEEAAWA